MFAGILPIVGALLQIALLWLTQHFGAKENLKQEAKELKDEFKKAIAIRDYAYMRLLWARVREG